MTSVAEWFAGLDPTVAEVAAGLIVAFILALVTRARRGMRRVMRQVLDPRNMRRRLVNWHDRRQRRRLLVNQRMALTRCRRAVRSGETRVVALTGEVGQGTSFLLQLALAEAGRRAVTLSVDVRDASSPVQLVQELARRLSREVRSTPSLSAEQRGAADARALVGAVQGDRPTWDTETRIPITTRLETGAHVLHSVGESVVAREQRLRWALLDDLAGISLRVPVVIGIDGVDDPQGMPWLETLVADLEPMAAVLLACHRPPPVAWERRGWESTVLRQLTGEERADLVRRRLRVRHRQRVSVPVAEHIAVQADARSVAAATAADRYALLGHAGRSRGVQSAIEHLTEGERQALEELSALEWFTKRIAREVCGIGTAFTERLLRHPLVTSGDTVARVHDAVRSELRSRLVAEPERMTNVHGRAAAALEACWADLDQTERDDPATRRRFVLAMCHHHLRSAPLEEARARIGSEVSTAIDRQEAELAASLIHDVAADTGADDPWVVAWLAALSLLHGDAESTQARLRVLDLDADDLDRLHANALLSRARARYQTGAYTDASTDLERVIQRFSALSVPDPEIAYVEEQLAKVRRMTGDLGAALVHHRRAEARHRNTGDTFGLASALGSYGTTLMMVGQHDRARSKLDESIQLARDNLHGVFLTTGLRSRAMVRVRAGQPTAALGDCREATQRADQIGDDYDSAVATAYAAEAHGELLRPEAAHAIDDAVTCLQQIGATADAANALTARALVRWLSSHDTEHALGDVAEAVEYCESIQFSYGVAWVSLRAGEIQRWSGLPSDAEASLVRCREAARRTGAEDIEHRATVELSLLRGEAAELRQRVDSRPADQWIAELPPAPWNIEPDTDELGRALAAADHLTPLRRADVACWLIGWSSRQAVIAVLDEMPGIDLPQVLRLAPDRTAGPEAGVRNGGGGHT